MLMKYLLSFFIINCILLINNYTVEAAPPLASETSLPKDVVANAKTGCLTDGSPCVKANATLLRCNGILTTPGEYIDANIFNGTYEPEQKSLAKCMCNQEFYSQVTGCVECFKNFTKTAFEVAPVSKFKSRCEEFGIQYTEIPPDEIKTGLSSRVKYAIAIVATTFLLIILALIGYKCFAIRRKKNKKNKNRDSVKPLTLSNKNLHDEPLIWKDDNMKSMSSINVSKSKVGEYNPSTIPQQPQPIITDYQQQQNYYPASSNQPISNMQIPTQSGEISHYPPPESLKQYQDNNNTSDGYYTGYNNHHQY